MQHNTEVGVFETVKFDCKILALGRKQLHVPPTYMIKLEFRNVVKMLRL